MSQAEIITIMRDAIFTTIIAAAPMLIVAIVVGLLVSIFQATTQINEQTLAFVPKIVAVLLTLLLFGGFIISTLTGFITRMFESVIPFIS
ncbi:MAG: flagellar biosynthesis protein FliQ [Oscillospiraceae bacterium]|jgi:flagellar biosynthetic protein FliQ|nr:flagellar biosynthesis protein FliQ [Oscillospiraceae bacterium]